MDELTNLLIKRKKEIESLCKTAKQSDKTTPKGKLYISKCKGSEQYYWRKRGGNLHGKYIKKSEKDMIHGLSQREYNSVLYEVASRELRCIEEILNIHEKEIWDTILTNLPPLKQKLITPYQLPIEEYVKQWSEKDYPTYYEPDNTTNAILTERGEAVRSKSEKILADKFDRMGIPYHYEKPLILQGYGTIHPDFTLLNIRTRKTYYWEHLGLLGNPEYSERAILKIELFHSNGIFQGENLILTYEADGRSLNMREVDMLIKKYLI